MAKGMEMRWIIDRFEEGFALLEDPETMETKEFPRTELPEGTREGDILIEEEGVFNLDRGETEKRAKNIRERFNRLKKIK